jgi:hypothetical protein
MARPAVFSHGLTSLGIGASLVNPASRTGLIFSEYPMSDFKQLSRR